MLRCVSVVNTFKHSGMGGRGGMRGETTLQMVVPLVILLFFLLGIAMIMPSLSPTKTIALAGGVVIFVVSFISTEIALYILIFSMLLSPEFVVGTTAGASLGRGVTLRVDDFLLAIIGFSWVARMAINKELGLFLKTPLNKPIGYYIIICLVSTLLGAVFGRVDLKTGFFFVLKYFEYMIVYFMVVNYLRSKKQVQYFLWALLLTCAVVSIIGMSEIPGGGRVSAPFEGEVGEPNTFGGYLVFMMAIITGLLVTSPYLYQRAAYGLLLFLCAVPLFYTQSRSSYLAAIPAFLSFIWIFERKYWIIPALLLLGLSLPYIAPEPAKERISYTFTQGRERGDVVTIAGIKLDTSTSDRLRSWKEASKDWIKHPVLGFGVTGYRFVDAQYVRVVTETGFLGVIVFFILLATILRETLKVKQTVTDPLHKGLAGGFVAGFVGLLFHAIGANTFIIVRIMEPFWFTAAMVIMLPEIEKNEDQLPEASTTKASTATGLLP
jgi:hypothetical protein